MGKYQKILKKIINSTWDEEFELPDGSYSISDIQDYFEYMLKKHWEKAVNPAIKRYVSKVENIIE